MGARQDRVVLCQQLRALEMKVFVGRDVVLITHFFEPVGYVKVR